MAMERAALIVQTNNLETTEIVNIQVCRERLDGVDRSGHSWLVVLLP